MDNYGRVSRPVTYPLREFVKANKATHDWMAYDDDIRCAYCDCRISGTVAEWPCGAIVPREELPLTQQDTG